MPSYVYLNAVSSSKQARLLDREILLAMAKADSFLSAINLLQSTSYSSVIQSDNIDEIFNKEQQNLINFIKNECKNAKIVRFFTLFYDYDNIEAVIKSKKIGYEASGFVEVEGDYSIDQIKFLLKSKDYDGFKNPFVTSLCREVDALKEDAPPRDLNYIFDKYKFMELASLFDRGVLKTLTDFLLDCENIATAYRVQKVEEIDKNIVTFGKISKDFLIKMAKRDFAIREIEDNNLQEIAELLFYQKKDDLYKFEQIKARNILRILESELYFSNEPINFLYYVYLKTFEIKNLRMIFALQKNNLANKIKNRLLLK